MAVKNADHNASVKDRFKDSSQLFESRRAGFCAARDPHFETELPSHFLDLNVENRCSLLQDVPQPEYLSQDRVKWVLLQGKARLRRFEQPHRCFPFPFLAEKGGDAPAEGVKVSQAHLGRRWVKRWQRILDPSHGRQQTCPDLPTTGNYGLQEFPFCPSLHLCDRAEAKGNRSRSRVFPGEFGLPARQTLQGEGVVVQER